MHTKKRKVLVFGTFDILHPGHIWFLKKAKKYGDYLVVVVGRDEITKQMKGKAPHFREQERLQMIKNLKLVDRAILGDHLGEQRIVAKEKPDVICWGYDQKMTPQNPFNPHSLKKIKQVRIPAYKPEKFASSKIINRESDNSINRRTYSHELD